MSVLGFFIPVWGLVTIAGVTGWQFGFKLIGGLAVFGGLVMGGIINF